MPVDERTLLVDYEALDEILGHLQAMQDQALEMRDLLTRHSDNLEGGLWKGQDAVAYYHEVDDVIKLALDRLVGAMEEAQSTLKQMKGETQSLEEQVAAAWREMIGMLPSGGLTGRAASKAWADALQSFGTGLNISGWSLTGLGKLASNVAADARLMANARHQQMVSIFARGGEAALRRTGVHSVVADWTSRSARAARSAEVLGRWSDRLGKGAAIFSGASQGVRSSAETWVGKVSDGGAAGAFAWGTRANPWVFGADMAGMALGVDGPSSIMNGSFESIAVTTEGLITGSPVGMSNLHERQLAGEWGPMFREAAEAGDFWTEHGVVGGMGMFWDAVTEPF